MRFGLKGLFPLVLSLAAFAQASSRKQSSPTDIQKFLDAAEARLNQLNVKANRAGWVQETYITDDTEAISAAANENMLAAISEFAAEAKRFEGKPMTPEQARKLKLVKLLAAAPAPANPAERAELAQLGTWLDGAYGKGKYCPKTGPFAGQCL